MSDHRTLVGAEIDPPDTTSGLRQVDAFLAWAGSRDLTWAARRLIRLITPTGRSEPHLLGAVVAFLAQKDSNLVLRQWAASVASSEARWLLRISDRLLVSFPPLSVPPPSRPMHLLLRGHMEWDFLGALLGTRRPPRATRSVQLSFACLRCWLLVKALQYGRDGNHYDRHLKEVCDQLRMALDEAGPQGVAKLDWFQRVADPRSDLTSFERGLEARIRERSAPESAWAKALTSAVESLVRGRRAPLRLPDSGLLTEEGSSEDQAEDKPVGWHDEDEGEGEGEDQEAILDEEEVGRLAGDEDEEPVVPMGVFQAARERRAISFLSVEERQYLPFTWNRMRPDELAAFQQMLRESLAGHDPAHRVASTMAMLALVTRLSLESLKSLPLSATPQDRWSLDIQQGRLHRLPARRVARWRAEDRARPWVRELADAWVIDLPPEAAKELSVLLAHRPTACQMGELISNWSQVLADYRSMCQTHDLSRVRSGVIAATIEQYAFVHSRDHVFSRLIGSSADAGIAGAGAYLRSKFYPTGEDHASAGGVTPLIHRNLVHEGGFCSHLVCYLAKRIKER